MKNLLAAPFLVPLALLLVSPLAGCSEDDVGVPCQIEGISSGAATSGGNLIGANSLDCLSRLCLLWETATEPRCTMVCESNDDCPEKSPNCEEGYSCVVARETGGLACCKMCVCTTDLTEEQREGRSSPDCANKTPTCPTL